MAVLSLYVLTVSSVFSVPFYKILVPTVDTVRYDYLLRTLIARQYPAMLVGPVGTGMLTTQESKTPHRRE